MHISFINVGYGDSILIECNDNNKKFVILIDGGKPEDEHYKNFPNRIEAVDFLKEKKIEKINLMIVSHLHEDHVGGLLEVAKYFQIDELWSSFVFPEEFLGKRLEEIPDYCEGASRLLSALNIYNEICCIMKNRGKVVKEVSDMKLGVNITDYLTSDIIGPAEEISLWQKNLINSIYAERNKMTIESCLNELNDNMNNASIVLRLIYRDKKVLLPGDLYNSYWENLLKSSIQIQSDIWKLSHHGRLDSISEELIKAINPDYVVISVSNDREDNCPDPEVINLFYKCIGKEKKIEFLFTDAVDMPPYSTLHSRHKAVVFDFLSGIEYKAIY